MNITVRHPNGQSRLSIPEDATVQSLKEVIAEETKIKVFRVQLKCGYPPRPLEAEDSASLSSCGIRSGECFIVEEDKDAEDPANKPVNEVTTTEQVPDSDGKVMIRRCVPADNSCLFASVGYAVNRDKASANELRQLVTGFVMSDPENYNEIFLGKTPSEYCEWIMQNSSWGGAIELSILAKAFSLEICAVSIQNLRADVFGEDLDFDNRIYVIYDGIHYDVLVRNTDESAAEGSDATIFPANDGVAFTGALFVANKLRKDRQFVDVGNFTLMCGQCNTPLEGQAQALEHAQKTGHTNFQEYSK